MSTLAVKVLAKRKAAEGVASFELAAQDGAELPPFTAGAHIDVHLGDGLVRQYSLCNAPHERHRYRIAVLHTPDSRGGSRAMHELVEQGGSLTIGAPRNHFPLDEGAPALLLAGGIGITPLLAMAEALHAQGRPFALHYCARSHERAAFVDDLLAGPYAAQVHLHLDDRPGTRLDLAALLAGADPTAHLYVCGPGGFIEHVLGGAAARGWPEAQLHREYFSGATVDTTGDQAFEVCLASSGRVIPVLAHQTVVSALAEHGVDVMTSCGEGVCGTCLTRVIDGVPEHRDNYLSDEERAANKQFTPCCSRARSARLVLDL